MSEQQQGESRQGSGQQPDRQRDLAGLLGGLLGGQPAHNLPEAGGTGTTGQSMPGSSGQPNDVANILGGLLGGSGAAGGQGHQGGIGQQGDQQANQGTPQMPSDQGSSGDLAGLLGGLLGGAGGGTPAQQGPQGGTSQQGPSGGDLMGMLGGLLGSVIGNHQASSTMSQQTGLSQQLVQALLPMIIGMLLNKQQGAVRGQGINVPQGESAQNAQEFNQVAQRVQRGEQVSPQQIQSAGFTKALAQHSGYSESEVAPAVVKILEAMGQHGR